MELTEAHVINARLIAALEKIARAARVKRTNSPYGKFRHSWKAVARAIEDTANAAIRDSNLAYPAASLLPSPDHLSSPDGCEDGCPACGQEVSAI